ncbi:hypothetical protein [Plantactinospora sp. WMMB782]|uniref:hypothetical protein n=1 Tax=Plantactinospora sp. WMMB782 TaxID=3404121 RepID=UPI003B94FF70
MTTTALAFPEPADDRTPLDREAESLIRWASATLADPTTDDALRSDLTVALDSFDVFNPARRPNIDPQLRSDLLDIYRNPPPPGRMWDAVFGAAMNAARRREVA